MMFHLIVFVKGLIAALGVLGITLLCLFPIFRVTLLIIVGTIMIYLLGFLINIAT